MFLDTMEFNNHFSPMGIQNFYVGKVVANNDPKKLGRVKVSIAEIFGSASNDVLPWVTSFVSSPHEFNCPEVGDEVVVFFPFGIVYFPCFIGHWHLKDAHDTVFDSDYPDTVGFNRQGFSVLYNKKAKTLDITHPTGAKVSIDAGGKISFDSPAEISIKANADVSLETTAKAKIKADGGLTFETDADAEFKGKGKTTVGDSSSQTFVNGQMVLLAGGGVGIAVIGSQAMGVGNLGAPVISSIITGSSKVVAPM